MLKQKHYPTKTYVNLIVREHTPRQLTQAAVGLVALVLLVGVFCKFAVVDRLNAASRAQAQAAAVQLELSQLQAANAEYESVRVEYGRYFSSELTTDTAATADCMEVLSLLESKLMTRAGISSAVFSDGLLSVQLTGVNLDGASALLADLYTSPIVGSVVLSTADAQDAGVPDENSTVSMTITLVTEGGDGA